MKSRRRANISPQPRTSRPFDSPAHTIRTPRLGLSWRTLEPPSRPPLLRTALVGRSSRQSIPLFRHRLCQQKDTDRVAAKAAVCARRVGLRCRRGSALRAGTTTCGADTPHSESCRSSTPRLRARFHTRAQRETIRVYSIDHNT